LEVPECVKKRKFLTCPLRREFTSYFFFVQINTDLTFVCSMGAHHCQSR